MANQPKQKHAEKLASRTERIVELVKELGFFPEDVLHPVALHNAIESRESYTPLTLSSGKVVDRFSAVSPTAQANLVIIRSGATWQITRVLLVPHYGSDFTSYELEKHNLELAEILD